MLDGDLEAPPSLKKLQDWFGSVITGAIDDESRINPIAPSGNPIEEESALYIKPNKTLSSKERIQIYNQQYWWRLLSIMQENFPLLTHLFGYYAFNNSIAVPYLQRYPSTHWSLSTLGDTLPHWITEYYHEDDRTLVLESALIDLYYNLSFMAEELKSLDAGEAVLKKKIALQPHLFTATLSYDLIPFRTEVLQHDPDYFADHDFPKLQKRDNHIAIYRTQSLNITWKELSYAEHQSLMRFKEGLTVEDFCAWIETQERTLRREAEKNLILWFKEWTALGLIGQAL